MDKFIVSARKYRPQNFESVIGQAHITTTLKNAIIQQQLAHAFLFCGPRGVGKTTCARILAKTINCEHPTPDGEACNKCTSCASFNTGASLNIHELDAASNNSVDDIRSLVEQVRFPPQAGKYKVYIIDEAHVLSSAAFNAFLKTLEEPPPYAIFILATTEKHKILPTILSRCQIFDFKRITIKDTVAHLQSICDKESIKADKAALQVIAQKSEGCMRDSLSIMDKIVSFSNGELTYTTTLEHLNILDEDYYFKLMESIIRQDLSSAMLLYADINGKGFEGDMVLNGFAEFIRNLLICNDEKVASLLDVVEGFKGKYLEMAKNIPIPLLISALNILNEAEINYRIAKNKRLHVELTLIKLCYLPQALQLTVENQSLSKKKLIETASVLPFKQIQPFELRKKEKKPAKEKEPDKKAVLLVEESPAEYKNKPSTPPPPAETHTNILNGKNKESVRLQGLDKIRQQYQNSVPKEQAIPLQTETLQQAWEVFIAQLKEEKNPAVQSFEMATLKVLDDNSFYIFASGTIEYRFIDSNKNNLSEYLQEKFNNKQLQFYITKVENKEQPENSAPQVLSAVEQYQKMIENYPMIQVLKEKLKLELDR
ncbi:MAG: DNA polymerase III subunit gamma/tau [Sphingobacteriales bacterium]|jgi:DNA polymerase-3 subunit gamma/tau|nr:DNA polymerase III subunit gamma/tau [Sphingobacteriales bacterium]